MFTSACNHTLKHTGQVTQRIQLLSEILENRTTKVPQMPQFMSKNRWTYHCFQSRKYLSVDFKVEFQPEEFGSILTHLHSSKEDFEVIHC